MSDEAELRRTASLQLAQALEVPLAARGPKRLVTEMARAVGLDIVNAETTGQTGRRIARRLDEPWPDQAAEASGSISSTGLLLLTNAAYLHGVKGHVDDRKLAPTVARPPGFVPAKNKNEVVNRISALTNSGPETLGPGSKEHKSVLINFANVLAPGVDTRLNKEQLLKRLLSQMGVSWSDTFASTGQTLSLQGLNALLAAGESLVSSTATAGQFPTATVEGEALLRILSNQVGDYWDGRSTIEAMREGDSRNWRQTEWQGFWFEELAFAALNNDLPMDRSSAAQRRFGNVTFDFAHGWVWDLKCHTRDRIGHPSLKRSTGSASMWLNDERAIRDCVEQQGLGFVVLHGDAYFDETGAFDAWHRVVTSGRSNTRSNSGRSRARKMAFSPMFLDAYWFEDKDELERALLARALTEQRQGRQQVREGQSTGAPRATKLGLSPQRAQRWLIGREEVSPS